MKHYIILIIHLSVTLIKLIQPGGYRSLIAENLLLKQQLLIHSRSRSRAPNLHASDRILLGLTSLLVAPRRLARTAIIIQPSTLLNFHSALVKKKYQQLFSAKTKKKHGPKGPSKLIIDAVIAIKQRNPRYGCPRIAQQINLAFGLHLDKDIVRRVLATHYRPEPPYSGPSWLTTLAHAKDSLWSVDLFRCESIVLRSHWVLVVMDQYTRRIIGFGVHNSDVDGPALCRMFNTAIFGFILPKRLSSDNDPLFTYYQWRANLRVLEIEEIKSIPYVPISHPFIERLIGSIRRELLDQTFFWTAKDLENKLVDYQDYYNQHRTHAALVGNNPIPIKKPIAKLANYHWQSHCRGLFELPVAA